MGMNIELINLMQSQLQTLEKHLSVEANRYALLPISRAQEGECLQQAKKSIEDAYHKLQEALQLSLRGV
jgi:hypothetical protein